MGVNKTIGDVLQIYDQSTDDTYTLILVQQPYKFAMLRKIQRGLGHSPSLDGKSNEHLILALDIDFKGLGKLEALNT